MMKLDRIILFFFVFFCLCGLVYACWVLLPKMNAVISSMVGFEVSGDLRLAAASAT